MTSYNPRPQQDRPTYSICPLGKPLHGSAPCGLEVKPCTQLEASIAWHKWHDQHRHCGCRTCIQNAGSWWTGDYIVCPFCSSRIAHIDGELRKQHGTVVECRCGEKVMIP